MDDPTTATSASAPPPSALIQDVDGTLLDTNYLHVIAWWESFRAAGHEVSAFDIHRAVGRGSGDLVETLLGEPDDVVVEGHAQRWAPLRARCLPFHHVPELIRTCAGRGMQVVYCTSGGPRGRRAVPGQDRLRRPGDRRRQLRRRRAEQARARHRPVRGDLHGGERSPDSPQ